MTTFTVLQPLSVAGFTYKPGQTFSAEILTRGTNWIKVKLNKGPIKILFNFEVVCEGFGLRPETGPKRFVLVYQAGIANIFEVQCFNAHPFGRDAIRVYQGDFRTAEAILRGAQLAGSIVTSMACNMVGDIINQPWTTDLENQPFFTDFNVVAKLKSLDEAIDDEAERQTKLDRKT